MSTHPSQGDKTRGELARANAELAQRYGDTEAPTHALATTLTATAAGRRRAKPRLVICGTVAGTMMRKTCSCCVCVCPYTQSRATHTDAWRNKTPAGSGRGGRPRRLASSLPFPLLLGGQPGAQTNPSARPNRGVRFHPEREPRTLFLSFVLSLRAWRSPDRKNIPKTAQMTTFTPQGQAEREASQGDNSCTESATQSRPERRTLYSTFDGNRKGDSAVQPLWARSGAPNTHAAAK